MKEQQNYEDIGKEGMLFFIRVRWQGLVHSNPYCPKLPFHIQRGEHEDIAVITSVSPSPSQHL